ncbi:MAG: Cys-tRNA(Pro) deacylase [Synergistaceae bacterium]|nr:Cys-tRNA(Pro) deacylase [Synergistaceae bacterium]
MGRPAPHKTNALRLLDKSGIVFRTYEYDTADGRIDGLSVAEKTGRAPQTVYKTLVCVGQDGASREYCVFVIPVAGTLDLKLAAKAVGVKSVEMIPVADISRVTGYVRGGCSPVGMKREYTTVIDASCEGLSAIVVSAGKIGLQMELDPHDLIRVTGARTEPVTAV